MKIALLGASGQIGKSLLTELGQEYEWLAFARDVSGLQAFLKQEVVDSHYQIMELAQFGRAEYDLIINAIGPGAPARMQSLGPQLLDLTLHFDALTLAYLQTHPQTKYINCSTGAVYGTHYIPPVTRESALTLQVNHLDSRDIYPLAKLAVELKHRCLNTYAITDLRIFGFYSRFIDLNDSFLISQMTRCCLTHTPFLTSGQNFIRDYIGPHELAQAIRHVIALGVPNRAYDLSSGQPISKAQMVDLFSEYGMKYQIGADAFEPLNVPTHISTCQELYESLYQTNSDAVIKRELSYLLTAAKELNHGYEGWCIGSD